MQFRIGVPIQEFAMLYPSPLDYLTAFALAFAGGAVCAIGLYKYIDRVRKEARVHA
ncbi:Uncharacterised protein [Burkholderia pseudomallei]|uniref:hypothetical protein n=1 Tax=Burkholderia pseudomallei TaxID=28450 RepID=UPI000F27D0B2|nr:hypothetical protein [Burkholderia pseudomallei]CAJ3046446.1 Uncharacterised protein [Burkholderia pseudomallei]CAJ3565208.1 Uncharacterised protein [Burkholderia pseudomallei]CAJ3758751.1 Uncharacterised protein [Burkholderia pseudomallei]CAJ3811959.1 Uncharacterised protein [Burkholderia pseudomallei]CAJ3982287.1 Uncharacterised protein [Burkholderia pseudomallei]